MSEEEVGQKKWSTYHSEVLKYKTGLSDKTRTIELVKLIANEAIGVLQLGGSNSNYTIVDQAQHPEFLYLPNRPPNIE